MPNMACQFIMGVGVSLHTKDPPRDEEFEHMLELMRSCDLDNVRFLAVTDGGAPNKVQRMKVNDILAGRSVPNAVVSSAKLVRGVVMALSWFNPDLKVFAPKQMKEALRYLSIDDSQMDEFRREFTQLRAQLGEDALKDIPMDW